MKDKLCCEATGSIDMLRYAALALLLATWFLTGCERPTHVRIKGGAAPVFVLSGSGKLCGFWVNGQEWIDKAQAPFDDEYALWEIKPAGGGWMGTDIGDLGSITYGAVPPGYVQVKPQVGPTPSMVEGQKYFYEVCTMNAPGAQGYVEIRNSRAVATEGPDVCFGGKGAGWARVPCLE